MSKELVKLNHIEKYIAKCDFDDPSAQRLWIIAEKKRHENFKFDAFFAFFMTICVLDGIFVPESQLLLAVTIPFLLVICSSIMSMKDWNKYMKLIHQARETQMYADMAQNPELEPW